MDTIGGTANVVINAIIEKDDYTFEDGVKDFVIGGGVGTIASTATILTAGFSLEIGARIGIGLITGGIAGGKSEIASQIWKECKSIERLILEM